MGNRIKELRQALGLTQQEFADRIGVKRGAIANYEIGRNASDTSVALICREFGVSEHWLRTGEGEMFVRLSREEEITKFLMTVIRDPDSEFQRQLLATMAKLEPAQWQLMEQMLDDLIAQRTKKEGTE